MERVEGPVRPLIAEHLERLLLRRGGKGNEGQVLVTAVARELVGELVLPIGCGLLGFRLDLGVLLERVTLVGKGALELERARSRLG